MTKKKEFCLIKIKCLDEFRMISKGIKHENEKELNNIQDIFMTLNMGITSKQDSVEVIKETVDRFGDLKKYYNERQTVK